MKLRFLWLVAWILLPICSWASIEIGVGQNSTFSGRFVPTLTAGYSNSGSAFSFFSSGVQNDYYYQSVYGAHFFRQKKTGELLGGEIHVGLGIGLIYTAKGFQDEGSSSETEKGDVVFGPAFRVNWTIFPHTFINFDATYGLRELGSHILLNFQDVIVFSVGVRLW